jgi:hypothetical protein
LHRLHRRLAQFGAHLLVEFHARRDLDDLLVPPLHRTIAFVQVNDVAMLVAENLDLDVFRARNVALEEHRGIAEGATGFALRFIEQIREIAGLVHHAHPATTAAECRFDDERETNLLRDLQRFTAIFDRVFRARQYRDIDDFLRERAGGGFVAHVAQQFHARPDERDARLGARLGELGVLRQEIRSRDG